MSFRSVIDKFQLLRVSEGVSGLFLFLSQLKEDFKKFLLLDDSLSCDELRYIFDKLENVYECFEFEKSSLLAECIERKAVSFKEMLEKYCTVCGKNNESAFQYLISDTNNRFKSFIENSLLSHSDIKSLLENIQTSDEFFHLVLDNTFLLAYSLDNFLIDNASIDKFNELLSSSSGTPLELLDRCTFGFENRSTFFTYIRSHCQNMNNSYVQYDDERSLKLESIDTYEKIYALKCDDEAKEELFEILKVSKKAQNILKQLIDANLLSTYDFNDLKQLLTKDDSKKKQRLNF